MISVDSKYMWWHFVINSLLPILIYIYMFIAYKRLPLRKLREIGEVSIVVSHTRKSLVKGERFMRFEWKTWVKVLSMFLKVPIFDQITTYRYQFLIQVNFHSKQLWFFYEMRLIWYIYELIVLFLVNI